MISLEKLLNNSRSLWRYVKGLENMNLPNKLTILRIILTVAFIFFLLSKGLTFKLLALFTFLLACLTDALDGFIAKRNNQITDFGKLMDPIADKILVLSAFLVFVEMRLIPAWMVVIIIFREVAVTGLRILALTQKRIIPADLGGKHKTVWQVFAILAILIFLIFTQGGRSTFGFWSPGAELFYKNTIFIIMLITVTLTLISGFSYLIKNREVYSNANTKTG